MNVATLGEALKARRKSRNISQDDIAGIAEISVRTLRDIENGAGNPELLTLMKICKVLGMEISINVIK